MFNITCTPSALKNCKFLHMIFCDFFDNYSYSRLSLFSKTIPSKR